MLAASWQREGQLLELRNSQPIPLEIAAVYRKADGAQSERSFCTGWHILAKNTPPVTGGVFASPQKKDEQNDGKRDSK